MACEPAKTRAAAEACQAMPLPGIAHQCPLMPSEPATVGLQGAEMLQEVAAVSPQEYERQQKDDLASSGGVRNVAKFVESLADR